MNYKLEALIIGATAILIVAGLYTFALTTTTTQQKISNTGTIKAIGVKVYSDPNCTQKITQISWGEMEPATSKNVTVYVKSVSTTPITLTVYTENWSPQNCIDYMNLTSIQNNITMQPSEVISTTLTLAISPDIEGIIDFSFDIVFNGSS